MPREGGNGQRADAGGRRAEGCLEAAWMRERGDKRVECSRENGSERGRGWCPVWPVVSNQLGMQRERGETQADSK